MRHDLSSPLSMLETMRARFAEVQREENKTPRGDHVLNGLPPPRQPWREAAVLIPLHADDDGRAQVLFTLRTPHLSAHAGQVSFPGGAVDLADCDAVAAALREAREEIGLVEERVEVIGTLCPYITMTGFYVTPVVGVVTGRGADGGLGLAPNPGEVADVFSVPMTYILSPSALRRAEISLAGRIRQTYVCAWQAHHIWGATAAMLHNLVEVIRK